MSRPPRIVIPGHPLHVILRGNNRRRLVTGEHDIRRLLFYLGLALGECEGKCQLHALVVMANHLHLILLPEDAPTLSKLVKRFSQRYAQMRNRDKGATGKLFEQRFASIPILDERQLAVTTAYVELNPVRAGIVRTPDEYPWSTYALHAGQSSVLSPRLWTPSAWYDSLGQDPETRANEYTSWVRDCAARGEAPAKAELVGRAEAPSQRPPPYLVRPNGTSAL